MTYPKLQCLVSKIEEWFTIWAKRVPSSPHTLTDSTNPPQAVVKKLTAELRRVQDIIHREHSWKDRRMMQAVGPSLKLGTGDGTIEALWGNYNGPGPLCPGGPRHDNDSANIAEVRVAPTQQELLCPLTSYLPPFLPEAPHHLELNSMERHLDIQFRLLREELM